MRVLRWVIGLLLIAAFLFVDFFVYRGPLITRFINVILFSSLFILYRVIVGPTPADRIIAVYSRMLVSMYHARCEYPRAKSPSERRPVGADQHHQPSGA